MNLDYASQSSNDAPIEPSPEKKPPSGDERMARQAAFFPKLYLPILCFACLALTWRPLRGTDDFWAHAAIGRWIVQHADVPHQTLFLWGREPIEWVYHSWLSQVAFFSVLAVGGERYGPYLAQLLAVACCSFPFVMLWRTWLVNRQERALESGRKLPELIGDFMPFLFLIGIWCSAPRFRPRPEMFTAVFLTILLLFLIHWSRRPAPPVWRDILLQRKWQMLGLIALFVVWANFHGAVALGLAVLGLTVIADLVQERASPRSLALAGLALMCVAAILINPYGAEYFGALKPVGGKMFAAIDEWKPFWKEPQLALKFVYGEAILAALALAAWSFNPQRRWAHALWVLFMFASFIGARRHLWMLAVVCLAVLATAAPTWSAAAVMEWSHSLWQRVLQRRRVLRQTQTEALLEAPVDHLGEPSLPESSPIESPAEPRLRPLPLPATIRWFLNALNATLLAAIVSTILPKGTWPLRGADEFLPVQGVDFLQQRRIPGRLFNDYETSSYLQWRLSGQPPLYIDLLNAYPDELMAEYLEISRASPRGKQLLDELKIDWVFLRASRRHKGISNMAAYLDGNPAWRRIYNGKDATIWQRRKPMQR